jgi:AcrR family transcriptional regulator
MMADNTKRRAYDASSRRKAAAGTVRSILVAARRLFFERGYVATTMPAIAHAAGIAVDTVYASVGKKPKLFALLVEAAISGQDEAVAAEQRGYVRQIRAAPEADRKLRLYAAALRDIHPRLAPIVRVLQAAAPLDGDLAALWREIAERRAANMRLLAADLLKTGQVRRGLPLQKVADIIWTTGSPECYLLLVDECRWTLDAFERWLGDSWIELLLAKSPKRRARGVPYKVGG